EDTASATRGAAVRRGQRPAGAAGGRCWKAAGRRSAGGQTVKGATAQLECEIAGTAPFEISWLKNRKPITGDEKYKILSQDSLSRLEIQTFESADIGDYQCVVSNDVGKVTAKASAKLKVESVTAVLGNAVKLQGTIKGSAPITVKWMKDSEILRDDDPNIKMVFENNLASLAITAVAIGHGGKYSCQAENEAGQQKCEATLTVQGQRKSLTIRPLLLSFHNKSQQKDGRYGLKIILFIIYFLPNPIYRFLSLFDS
uniref:Ig-like domain-containing protein n=1 Tax=Fundulus heteroclitus TaxID=8078 RepID=A0A3Q2Q028_FUNHE